MSLSGSLEVTISMTAEGDIWYNDSITTGNTCKYEGNMSSIRKGLLLKASES